MSHPACRTGRPLHELDTPVKPPSNDAARFGSIHEGDDSHRAARARLDTDWTLGAGLPWNPPRPPRKRRESKLPRSRRPISPQHEAEILRYADAHDFEFPDMTGWTTAIGTEFLKKMAAI